MKNRRITTKLLHTPFPRKDPHGSLNFPVYDNVAFESESVEELEAAFKGEKYRHIYSRISNPTVEYFEAKIRAITDAFSFTATNGITLRASPLIGGPSWLPVHVKVSIDGGDVFDYVPMNPTQPETLKRLLSLQPVPAEARVLPSPSSDRAENNNPRAARYAQRANDFCNTYNKDLHLVYNNCWTFAFEMIRYVTEEER